LCLVLAGCSTLGKKASTPATPTSQRSADRTLAAPADRAGSLTPVNATANPSGLGGLLAGQVITSYNRNPPGTTYIQVTEPPDPGKPTGAPVEVVADAQGYFTIQGLQPGRHYQLTARVRNGDQLLAGTTWATPPDPKVLIRISEDFANAATPAIPGSPAWPGSKAATPAPNVPRLPDQPLADQGWAPGRSPGASANPEGAKEPGRGFELGPPTGASTLPAAVPPIRPQDITQRGDALARNPSPTVNIPSAIVSPDRGTNPSVENTPPANGSDPFLLSSAPARVPSCVLTGQVLSNFALSDLNGKPWEFKRNHRGRLTLIDFWGTWCTHCLHAVPHLNIWQQRYGPYGLEIIGIAYEDSPPAQQAQAVNRVRQRLNIGYPLLLGGSRSDCPVLTQFQVVSFPTLVLLDENGRIVWRGEGLDARRIQELEMIFRQRLGFR
jgi:thiol-disulfide isomerase/thioredoxin